MILSFPDLSGETFENQVAHRTCKQAYVDDVNGEGGLVLFVTANRVNDGLTFYDMRDLLPDAAVKDAPKAWSVQAVPQQTQLVELLQFTQRCASCAGVSVWL